MSHGSGEMVSGDETGPVSLSTGRPRASSGSRRQDNAPGGTIDNLGDGANAESARAVGQGEASVVGLLAARHPGWQCFLAGRHARSGGSWEEFADLIEGRRAVTGPRPAIRVANQDR